MLNKSSLTWKFPKRKSFTLLNLFNYKTNKTNLENNTVKDPEKALKKSLKKCPLLQNHECLYAPL